MSTDYKEGGNALMAWLSRDEVTKHAVFLAELFERVETLGLEQFIASGQYCGFFDDDEFAEEEAATDDNFSCSVGEKHLPLQRSFWSVSQSARRPASCDGETTFSPSSQTDW